MAPGTALGDFLMRQGCFFGGFCHGRPTSLLRAVQSPHLSQPAHPTRFCQSGLNLINFFILVSVLKKKSLTARSSPPDILFNSSIRFFFEFFRGDPGRGWMIRGGSPYSSLTVPRFICLIGFVDGLSLCAILGREKRALA